ncbi:MAG: hypothetical protein KY428_05200 [Bacteroidetes bacterium]|nr:hypothetical protein [Bacteroidota bacterium]
MFKKTKIYLLLVFLICLLGVEPLAAQNRKKTQRPPKETGNTSFNSRIRNEPKAPKDFLYLYRSSTRGTLMGNKCLDDYTEKMGFRYVIMPANQEGSLSTTQIRMNNFGVKFLLLLKRGPFWHHRLSRQTKKCREKSGDFMGYNDNTQN